MAFGIPKYRSVEDKFQNLAFAIVMCIYAYLTGSGVYGCYQIWSTASSPPSTSHTYLRENWGHMPYIVIIHPYDTIYRAKFCDEYGACDVLLNFNCLKGNLQYVIASWSRSQPHVLLINATALTPIFEGLTSLHGYTTIQYGQKHGLETGSPPQLVVEIENPQVQGGYGASSFCVAPESLPAENITALKHPEGNWRFLTCRDMQVQLPDSSKGVYQYIKLRKSYIPREGIFWGGWWSDDHTQESFVMTVENQVEDYGKPGWTTYFITVDQDVITARKPQSILSRIAALIASVGGKLSFLTAIYYVLFVLKQKQKSLELTLYGYHQLPSTEPLLSGA